MKCSKCLMAWACQYVQDNPRDTLMFKMVVINLLRYYAKKTTNTVDERLVALVSDHLFMDGK